MSLARGRVDDCLEFLELRSQRELARGRVGAIARAAQLGREIEDLDVLAVSDDVSFAGFGGLLQLLLVGTPST